MRRLRFTHKQPNMWRDIQMDIPEAISGDLNGSRAFFQWLRTFEVPEDKRKIRPLSQRILEKCLQLGIIR
jgi:prephenate dehydrogenase